MASKELRAPMTLPVLCYLLCRELVGLNGDIEGWRIDSLGVLWGPRIWAPCEFTQNLNKDREDSNVTSSDFYLPRGMWHQEKQSELIERQGALKTRKLFTQFVPRYYGNKIQGFQILRGRIATLQVPLQLRARQGNCWEEIRGPLGHNHVV